MASLRWNPLGESATIPLIVMNIFDGFIAAFFLYRLIKSGKWGNLQIFSVVSLIVTLLMTFSRYIFNYFFYAFVSVPPQVSYLQFLVSLVVNSLLRIFQYLSVLHFMYLVSLAPLTTGPSKIYILFHYLVGLAGPIVTISAYIVNFIRDPIDGQTNGTTILLICFACILLDQFVSLVVFSVPILKHRRTARSLVLSLGSESAQTQGERKIYVALRFRWILAVFNFMLTMTDLGVILSTDNMWVNGYNEALFMWGQCYICLWIGVFGLQPAHLRSQQSTATAESSLPSGPDRPFGSSDPKSAFV